jgi:ribosomal protein S18 acetylase RimI-like enzyme
MAPSLALRPAVEGDGGFLREVYADSRREELEQAPWTEDQRSAFIDSQHAAQGAHYRATYPDAALHVVLADGRPAGRLWVHRVPSEIRILDLTLLRAYRGLGLGTRILEELLAEADARGQKLSIHVESWNRSRRLFERLGFRPVAEVGPYLLYERAPERSGVTSPRGG